jgi:hypothetical protein
VLSIAQNGCDCAFVNVSIPIFTLISCLSLIVSFSNGKHNWSSAFVVTAMNELPKVTIC